jgi:hypothetical protein
MATLSLILSATSGIVGAAGAVAQGQTAKATARYQAQVAENNKIMAERAAQRAEEAGDMAAQQARARARALIGRQRAVLAGSGGDVGVGSALDITGDTAMFGELDALTIRSNARRDAEGYRAAGANFQADADLARARGSSALASSYLDAGGSLLSSSGAVASKWYNFKKAGLV